MVRVSWLLVITYWALSGLTISAAWAASVGDTYVQGEMSTSSGLLFATTSKNDLLAIDLGTGALRWQRHFASTLVGATSDGGVVYVGAGGSLVRLRSNDGAEDLRIELDSRARSTVVYSGPPWVLVATSTPAKYWILDGRTGEVVRLGNLKRWSTWPPQLSGDVLAFSVGESSFRVISIASGLEVWEAGADSWALHEGILTYSKGTTLRTVTASTGKLRWQVDLSSQHIVGDAFAVSGDRVYAVSRGSGDLGRLLAFDGAKGRVAWGRPINQPSAVLLSDADSVIVVRKLARISAKADSLEVQAYSPAGERQWTTTLPSGHLDHPAAITKSVVLFAMDGQIIALSRDGGKLLWQYQL